MAPVDISYSNIKLDNANIHMKTQLCILGYIIVIPFIHDTIVSLSIFDVSTDFLFAENKSNTETSCPVQGGHVIIFLLKCNNYAHCLDLERNV